MRRPSDDEVPIRAAPVSIEMESRSRTRSAHHFDGSASALPTFETRGRGLNRESKKKAHRSASARECGEDSDDASRDDNRDTLHHDLRRVKSSLRRLECRVAIVVVLLIFSSLALVSTVAIAGVFVYEYEAPVRNYITAMTVGNATFAAPFEPARLSQMSTQVITRSVRPVHSSREPFSAESFDRPPPSAQMSDMVDTAHLFTAIATNATEVSSASIPSYRNATRIRIEYTKVYQGTRGGRRRSQIGTTTSMDSERAHQMVDRMASITNATEAMTDMAHMASGDLTANLMNATTDFLQRQAGNIDIGEVRKTLAAIFTLDRLWMNIDRS
ncbi:hypothetical protein CYMTET_9778 [Cymbomonas tetramitiformis]|uniref:Transmembrane protein n=1 Tax=Cymbomonas tetramitiformis TaxID=36881 RepID=A0AAE0GR41_9CHLO|nr:hypothetical protein CYMTET_9778 [Cymbomonas tetramitiformis]